MTAKKWVSDHRRATLSFLHDSVGVFSRWGEDPAIRKFFRSKIFWIVAAFKLVLGSIFASYYLHDLFTPFLNYFVESGFSNPWSYFFAHGRSNAFPYPPMMLYALTPFRVLFSPLLASGIDTITPLHLFVMRLPLFICDLIIALVLVRWFPARVTRILLVYWLSPLVIHITYWHGQLDVIPTAMLVVSLYVLRRGNIHVAMFVAGLALATKSHLLAALPFLVVYISQYRSLEDGVKSMAALLLGYFLTVGPYLGSSAYLAMVYGTPELARLFDFQAVSLSAQLVVYLAPAAIVLLWLRFTAYERPDWDLTMLYLGILFSIFIVLAPPAPGYIMWSLPFLVHFMCRSSKAHALPYVLYVASYLAFYLLGPKGDLFEAFQVVSPAVAQMRTPFQALSHLYPEKSAMLANLTFTTMQACLAGIVVHMYILGVQNTAAYRLRDTPIMVGLAGDSASGKDTLTGLLTDMFENGKATVICGDDYHNWPRGHSMWQVYTHLNVRANKLHDQHRHALALSRGGAVVKGEYDHHTGVFTEEQTLDPSEVVIFQGLHALAIQNQRMLYDFKIFLDPDDNLRKFWKVRRDCDRRGYSVHQVLESLALREPDRHKFIEPQKDYADLVIRLAATSLPENSVCDFEPTLILDMKILNSFDLHSLIDDLSNCPTLTVEHDDFLDVNRQSLRIRGSISADDIKLICSRVFFPVEEISVTKNFAEGLSGVIQLVFLVCLNQKLRWRRL
jgi:uridine kinase